MNTADYLLEQADESQMALITDTAQYTYRDLRDASARMAHEIVAAGIQPGDRVGLLARNSLFWIATYLGILRVGAIAVPLATTATPENLATQLAVANCNVVCIERSQAGHLPRSKGNDIPLLSDDVVPQTGLVAWPGERLPVTDRADAALMFTSGTTGRPRAVRVTHRNIQANTEAIIKYLGLTSSERILVVLPFYYCFGTSLLHTHLRVGGTLVVSNSFAYPETSLNVMAREHCTGFAGVPSVFQTLLRNSTFPKRSWPALRKVQQAGGRLPLVLIQELRAAVPAAEIYVMYGQTEATARLSYLPSELLETKPGSIGRGLPGVDLRVVTETGADVGPGEVGEIIARGESICPGYWQEPEATAEKFVDGVLHTGDLATVDEDGCIYIVDRKSDFIKSLGHRVSSQQIEACLQELPEVVGAAVVGVPDMARGEAIVAYVTLRTGTQLPAERLLAHCIRRLARHMVPKAVIVIDRLPMTSQGKVLKSELRRRATQDLLPAV